MAKNLPFSKFSPVLATFKTRTEVLESKTNEAVDVLANIMAALGEMLAYVDMDNIDKGTLATYGWLISGIGELQGQIAFENSEITYALKNCEAIYGKSAKPTA